MIYGNLEQKATILLVPHYKKRDAEIQKEVICSKARNQCSDFLKNILYNYSSSTLIYAILHENRFFFHVAFSVDIKTAWRQ